MNRIHLDNNATTHPLDEVRAAVDRALREGGNPSSAHASGRAARALIEDARDQVAALIGGDSRRLVFTSGGTEADNLAVLGGARAAVAAGADRRIVTTAVEHPAVEAACAVLEADGWEVVRVGVDGGGRLEADAFIDAVTPGTALATAMLLQNETGVVFPVARMFAAVRERSPATYLHTDAVQALGKVPVDVDALCADTVAVSAHKIHGPKGVGALWVRAGREPAARAHGGSQERGVRTGTENVPGIAGFGAAAAAARRDFDVRATRFAEGGARLEDALLAIPGARRNGPDRGPRHPGTLNVSFDGVRGDLLLMALDAVGVEVSTGSACASGAPVPSRSLVAMGRDVERAREAVRVSLSAFTSDPEIDAASKHFRGAIPRLRADRRDVP